MLQVLNYLAIAIRNVVAFYTAELKADSHSPSLMDAFVRRRWRWAWHWGLPATVLMALAGPILARFLRLPSAWPVWAASPAILLLFVRAVTDGVLQGTQAFTRFGAVQVAQALVRLMFAAGLICLGLQAAGAIFALPLAMAAVLVLALWWLRPHFQHAGDVPARPVSWDYLWYTLLGFACFAVLTNMDALFVKHFFSPRIAGDYAPVVTLARISLFIPLAMGIVLLPKVKDRQTRGESGRPVLLLALAGTVAPGSVLTLLYFLFPGLLVRTVFTGAYADPGVILGLASVAASLYAGLNVWLNYALALERPVFVYALVAGLILQALGMFLFGRNNLARMLVVMISCGAIANFAGAIATWHVLPTPKSTGIESVRA
jgi:O-antigen/teichoic acid export membrane protein